MTSMLDWVASLPLWLATLFLFVVVFFRAQCTFWLGKLSHHGILKTKWGQRLEKNSETSSGMIAIQKMGWPIIPLSFLTVGFQTAVQFGAGLLNWSWYKYTLAAIPGYLVWGFIYALGGLSLFRSLVRGSVGLFILFVIVILVVAIAANVLLRYIRKNGANKG